MSIRAFLTNFSFHFCCTGTVLAGNVGFLFGFGLYFVFFFRLVFFAFENNTAHHCFFYTHVINVLSINVHYCAVGCIGCLLGRQYFNPIIIRVVDEI